MSSDQRLLGQEQASPDRNIEQRLQGLEQDLEREHGGGSGQDTLNRTSTAGVLGRKRGEWCVFAIIGLKVGAYEKESEALQLLKIVWEDIAKKPKTEIDSILISWHDLDVLKIVNFLHLQKLINEHLDKLDLETHNTIEGHIMEAPPNAIKQNTEESASGKIYQAIQLQKLISEHLVSIHDETQNIIKQASGKEDKPQELQKLISEHIVIMHDETQNIIKRGYGNDDKAHDLQKLISNNITRMRSAITLKESQSSQEVRNMIPPVYREWKNKDGLTPVADAISLFLSSASILTFLSILTSRYAERDFVESLPKKLMLGISTLFLSITAMMITFSISFFILYHKEMKWIPIFITCPPICCAATSSVSRCSSLNIWF
ncbi:hypothetical protein L1987_38571 [Smallanthus sonchifolius]|uniref:Uncharacterized protein n=1 Tax=Smallanthus sonchifolius TaxID=185202 RepID=A0ACB9HKX3_9ASTR|nr:hypothetical protein L1987_38571 [Smallanthus sonchifolius]